MTKRWLSFFWRYGPWLFILIAAVAYYPRFLKSSSMVLYPEGAHCLLHGQVMHTCSFPFTYPPLFAFLMLPFDPMPMWLRNLLWYLVTLGATIGSFKLSEMIARSAIAVPLTAAELIWLRLLALVLSLKFLLAVFENQSYDALCVFAVLLGLAALVTGREFWGGAALAIGAALKATPIIFLPYLLWKRHFAAAAAFACVFILASYLPDIFFTPEGAAHGYFNTWLREVAGASLDVEPGVQIMHFGGVLIS